MQARFEFLRSHPVFEWTMIAVIIFSAVVVGVKTYDLPPLLLQIVYVLDWVITFIFLFELAVRFAGEPQKRHFFKSGWNIFDTVIVFISLMPAEDSELAFIGRLIRVFRVLRMVSIVPELRVLVAALFAALPKLGYVALLMFIIFYIYAAIGTQFFADVNPVLWGDIAISLLTLFRVMTFEDWTDVMYETMAVYPLSWAFYLSFIFFTAIAFLNMIIGIVVNVMDEEHKKQQAEDGEPTLMDVMVELKSVKTELVAMRTEKQERT